MAAPVRVLVAGLGNMGLSHAMAYHALDGFEIVGLRHHPSWQNFVDIARGLGTPLVMRMNLNQQSSGETWAVHKYLMDHLSPIVDCGVHYVDMMCLMTGARPTKVHAIGARLSDEVAADMYNYGQLQVTFDDGSVGWYEAGWGPMMSETAFFVKDVIGPPGCVSIIMAEQPGQSMKSDGVDAHTKTNALRLHHARLDGDGHFVREDEVINMAADRAGRGLIDPYRQGC